jgi:hypothetical protein
LESIPGLSKSLKSSSLMGPDWGKTGNNQLEKVSGGIKAMGHTGSQQRSSRWWPLARLFTDKRPDSFWLAGDQSDDLSDSSGSKRKDRCLEMQETRPLKTGYYDRLEGDQSNGETGKE